MGRRRKNPINVTKQCPTCGVNFLIKYSKQHQVYCSRACSQKSPSVIAKMKCSQKETFIEKYGVEHPMLTDATKLNFKKSMLSKYGVDHPSHMDGHREKVKLTLKNRYGAENYNNLKQMEKTMFDRYGVVNYRKTSACSDKIKQTCLKKYGVEHASQREELRHKHHSNMFIKFKNLPEFENFTPLFSLNDLQGMSSEIIRYKFKCNRCDSLDFYKLIDGSKPLCKKCDKDILFKNQNELCLFLKDILEKDETIIVDDLTILYPQEVDLYIPSKKIVVDLVDLQSHSELVGGKNKTYHLLKTKKCLRKEVECVQIFENEWNDKKEIVKSILKNKFKKCDNKFYARNCTVKILNKEECKNFLNENHIQGNDKSFFKIGLYHNNMLVSVMTFCKSRYNKNYEYELSRYCNKLYSNVVGGAEKLFSFFLKKYNPKNIITYSDRRFFSGEVYLKLKFNFTHNTSPNYFYISDNYKTLLGRISFQKHKLKKLLPLYEENLSEWENMKNNGYDRIWDCGHSAWVYTA